MTTPLVRGLGVLRALAAGGGRRSAGDLAHDTGLARSTVDRMLSTLARLRYVRLDGRNAELTPRAMELGNAYLASCRLPDLLGPYAGRLAAELDESVCLAVPDGDGARLIHQATRRRPMSVALRIGDLLPAGGGAPAALFAAGWSAADWRRYRGDDAFRERAAAARRDGWAVDDQLTEPGLLAVAVPVCDGGRPECAVCVISHTSRHDAASLRGEVLPRLRETAVAMERTLTAPPPRLAGPPAPPEAGALRTAKQELGPGFVESLARGIGILTAFGGGPLSLTAAAEATGLPRATARRSLTSLAHLGYAASGDRLFRLTPRVLDLGFACLSRRTLRQLAEPHLAALVERVHDSASMAVLAGDDIQYVARVPTIRIMSVDITVGTRFPAYATSMGRVLLAALPAAQRADRLRRMKLRPLTPHTATSAEHLAALLDRANRDEYVQVDGELEEGLQSIAVPVRGHAGTVAAINVSMHASRRTAREARESVLPHLRAAAALIEADLRVAGRYVDLRL